MKTEKYKLVAADVEYCSDIDEAAFFYWLNNIKDISWEGVLNVVNIYIETEQVNDETLRELLAFFYRYEIDSRQLKQFVNQANKSWVINKNAFWYKGLTAS